MPGELQRASKRAGSLRGSMQIRHDSPQYLGSIGVGARALQGQGGRAWSYECDPVMLVAPVTPAGAHIPTRLTCGKGEASRRGFTSSIERTREADGRARRQQTRSVMTAMLFPAGHLVEDRELGQNCENIVLAGTGEDVDNAKRADGRMWGLVGLGDIAASRPKALETPS